MRDCLQLQAEKTPYCHWSSRFPLLLNYVQELFLCSIRLPIPSWVHPHSRGENPQFLRHACAMSGSSPLTQGKQAASRGCCVAARLIPAHAGKTMRVLRVTVIAGAHPRSRGENRVRQLSARARTGSSPLTRGKRVLTNQVRRPSRLIPAHAGKTQDARPCAP